MQSTEILTVLFSSTVVSAVNNSLFSDSHIWHQIYLLEKKKSMSAEELKESKSMFVNIISCILKFDWERSKVEIKGNAQTKIVISSLILSFFLYSINWFLNHSISQEEIKSYFSYCIFYSIFVLFSLFVIIWADKWKNISQRREALHKEVASLRFL